MNEHRIARALNDIDDTFIEQAMPTRVRRALDRRGRVTRRLGMAAGLILALGICAAAVFGRMSAPFPDVSDRLAVKLVTDTTPGIHTPESTPGSDISISSRLAVTYREQLYIGCGTVVPRDETEYLLGTAPQAYYPTDALQIYKLRGVSERCAVAVGSREGLVLSVCTNPQYRPDTLDGLMNDILGAAEFTGVHYLFSDRSGQPQTAEYDCPADRITALLRSARDEKLTQASEDISDTCLTFFADIPVLGCTDVEISIGRDGRAQADVLGQTYQFRIGRTQLHRFVRYLTDNCDGQLLIYEQ